MEGGEPPNLQDDGSSTGVQNRKQSTNRTKEQEDLETWYQSEELKMMDDPDYRPRWFKDEDGERYLYCEKCDIEIVKGTKHCEDC